MVEKQPGTGFDKSSPEAVPHPSQRQEGSPSVQPEIIASLIGDLDAEKLNHDALDYAMNLVGESNQRLKHNLFMHTITRPEFMKGLAPSEDDLTKMYDILNSMRFDIFSDEKRPAHEKRSDDLMYFGKARETKAKEFVAILVQLINKKTNEEFSTILADLHGKKH